MSPVILIIGALLIILVAIMLLRTAFFSKKISPVPMLETTGIDAGVAADHLAMGIQIATVSMMDEEKSNRETFLNLHRLFSKLYPRVHSVMKVELINSYSLLYTWQGKDEKLDPVLFTGHLDVVPADPLTLEKWTHLPFSGRVADGFVWGRGTLDCKSQVMGALEAAEELIKTGYKPERTILLAFGHDEEIGGSEGAVKLSATLKQRGIHLQTVLDEGGAIMDGILPGVKSPVAMIGTAEKGYLSLILKVTSNPGHAAIPPRETAISILSAAILRLVKSPFPVKLDSVIELFKNAGSRAGFGLQFAFANTWLLGGVIRSQLEGSPETDAILRTTIAPTMIQGGVKDNILAAEAKAVINFRLMPGDTVEKVKERVVKVIHDKRVELEPTEEAGWNPSPASSSDDEVFTALDRTIRGIFPEVVTTPNLVLGATDARQYAPICEHVYRFSPLIQDRSDLSRPHGIDERISVEGYAKEIRFFVEIMKEWSKG